MTTYVHIIIIWCVSIFPVYCKLLKAVTQFYWYLYPGCLVPGIGSGLNVSLRMTKWEGRARGGKKIQNPCVGLSYSHCSKPQYHSRVAWTALNSFISPFPSYSLPLLNILFVLQFVQDCEFCKLWSRAMPIPVKSSRNSPWGQPAPLHSQHQEPGQRSAEGLEHSLTESSEKQRGLVTFLSYLHCRSLWIVSRLLSSSI